jgi:kinesin family protein C2/C3
MPATLLGLPCIDSRNVASSVTNSIPDIAVTTTNSHTTINSSSSRPLPVVTTRGVAGTTAAHSNSKPPRNNRRSTSNASGGAGGGNPLTTSTVLLPSSLPSPTHQLINSKNNNRSSRSNGADSEAQSDPPLISLQSSSCGGGSNTHNNNTNTSFGGGIQQKDQQQPKLISTTQKEKMVLEIPTITKMTSNAAPTTSNTPATSATAAHVHTHSTHNTNNGEKDDNDDDVGSIVSSITGAGFDQDLVEELHLALERMKVELEDSRAEASRAVKVAEQAIQSAENSNSKDWNNTVTHKAAEAAATAQKRSAEAMAKARIAEERLQIERKAAAGRKKQVEKAEQQAAHWQTRAAAAEIQRFAVAEALESERKKNMELLEAASANNDNNNKNKKQQDAFDPFDTDDTPSSNKSKSLTTSTITTPVTISQMTVVEVDRLRSKLAMESARRRKLLDELQDLRGAIRVYCRPRAPATSSSTKKYQPTIDMVSNEVLMLHRDRSSLSSLHTSDTATSSHSSKAVSSSSDSTPLCFEFDGILSSDMSQNDVYAEFEAICASVVEGYKVCIMTYGQADSGKTHTMLGEVHCNKKDHSVSIDNHGVHLRSMKQLFSLLEHRRDRFLDTVTLNLVEVHDERLIDLLAGTDFGEAHGRVEGSRKSSSSNSISSSRPKLEIKTNRDGETVLRGVLSVEVSSFEDVLCVWNEILAIRSNRLAEQDIDARAYELDSHVLATLKVSSINIVTGASASGQIQFVDFASSDVVSTKRSLGVSSSKRLPTNSSSDQLLEDWKFTNKSLNAVRDVVQARTQYQRSVPYRNSTITHVLSDSLEADTKVVMIACVSTDEKDVQNTTCTLQFAQEMRKVIVGKATRHTSIGKT